MVDVMDIVFQNFIEKCDIEQLKRLTLGKSIYIWGAYSRSESMRQFLLKEGLSVQGYIETKKRIKEYKGVRVAETLDEIVSGERRNFFIIPLENGKDAVLDEMIKHNVDIYNDVFWLTSEKRILFEGGYYRDECGNEIIGEETCKDKFCEIHFAGYGNKIWIGKGSIGNIATIHCSYGGVVMIGNECRVSFTSKINVVNGKLLLGKQVLIGENAWFDINDSFCEIKNNSEMRQGTECWIHTGASLIIGERCCVGSNSVFRGAQGRFELGNQSTIGNSGNFIFNGIIIAGEDCMFSDCVHMLAGNGHLIEYDGVVWGKLASQTSIILGKHVWIGFDAYIQENTSIEDGCIIGANARLRNIRVQKCSCVVGDGEIVKNDIQWKRELAE